MRIAFIVKSFPKISETFILDQITGLIDLRHKVEIFAFNNPKEDLIHPDIIDYNLMTKVTYIKVPKIRIKRIFKVINIIIKNFYTKPKIILNYLNSFSHKNHVISTYLLCQISSFFNKDFDIIHCCYGPLGVFGVMLRETGVIKSSIVTSFHGYDMSKYIAMKGCNVYNYLFKKGDIFLPVSEFFKKKLIELDCEENKIIVHRVGINLDKFKYRKIMKDNNKKIKLLTIGRMVEKKGIIYGIKAVDKVIKKYPEVEYNIIGNGPQRYRLSNLIEELRLVGKINILGFKTSSEVIDLIRSTDILLAPSIQASDCDMEGIPHVLKEAMAISIPVISTYHSGIPELVLDGFSGLLVPERDVDALEAKICYLIENPKIRRKMGINGCRFVKKYYDTKKLNLDLVNIFRKVLNNEIGLY